MNLGPPAGVHPPGMSNLQVPGQGYSHPKLQHQASANVNLYPSSTSDFNFFGIPDSNQNSFIPSNVASRGSSFASTGNSSLKFSPEKKTTSNDDGFGVFQTSEKDAWTMGQGIGKQILNIICCYSKLKQLSKERRFKKSATKSWTL